MADIDALSRETDDIYNLVFGLYEVWVSKEGAIEASGKCERATVGDRWTTDFKVPGYWKILRLHRAKLQLRFASPLGYSFANSPTACLALDS
jgi:hypothetical protein